MSAVRGQCYGAAVQLLFMWKLPTTVPQKKLSVPNRFVVVEYSVVYQKVQSSLGSTAMLL